MDEVREVHLSIVLIKCVKKYPFLYNTNLEEYLNKDFHESAWQMIANETKESVDTCKKRWTNLRASLSRHLRNQLQPGNRKKKYYLAEYMDFLVPFTKIRSLNGKPIVSRDPNMSLSSELCSLPMPPRLDEIAAMQYLPEDNDPLEKCVKNASNKRLSEVTQPADTSSSSKSPKIDELNDPDLNFLKSLLPDIRQMNRRQKNELKIGIINSIDRILNEHESHEITSNTEQHRSGYISSPTPDDFVKIEDGIGVD